MLVELELLSGGSVVAGTVELIEGEGVVDGGETTIWHEAPVESGL